MIKFGWIYILIQVNNESCIGIIVYNIFLLIQAILHMQVGKELRMAKYGTVLTQIFTFVCMMYI